MIKPARGQSISFDCSQPMSCSTHADDGSNRTSLNDGHDQPFDNVVNGR